MSIKDRTAIVGVGATPYYRRGQSLPQTPMEMACKAILLACEDAGLSLAEVDGFSLYAGSVDPAVVAQTLGIPEIRWATSTTSVCEPSSSRRIFSALWCKGPVATAAQVTAGTRSISAACPVDGASSTTRSKASGPVTWS